MWLILSNHRLQPEEDAYDESDEEEEEQPTSILTKAARRASVMTSGMVPLTSGVGTAVASVGDNSRIAVMTMGDAAATSANAIGAGAALDGALRGLKVACVEREDFSSGTSSRSTKLIWAGALTACAP